MRTIPCSISRPPARWQVTRSTISPTARWIASTPVMAGSSRRTSSRKHGFSRSSCDNIHASTSRGGTMKSAIARAGLEDIHQKVEDGTRLTGDDGLRLYACNDINALGYLANIVRERKNGNRCFFVRNLHINYTNVCNKDCKFCAFYVRLNDPAGYTLSPDDVRRRVEEQIHEPITEVHMVAGINPRLPYDYYLDIIGAVKSVRPDVMVKAYTMIEIAEIVRVAKKPLDEVWSDLKNAGLGSLPGGGAEVLSERIHRELFHLKQTPKEWLEMARSAHKAGL